MFETTRAVTNLVLSGTLDRYRNLKLIIPHAGATLPVLADRIVLMAGLVPGTGVISPDEIIPTLGRQYYDLAGVLVPRLLPALRTFADPEKLLYGSDWPHTPIATVERNCDNLDSVFGDEPDLLRKVRNGNATKLLAGSHQAS